MNILIIEDDVYFAEKICETFMKYAFANQVNHISQYQEYLNYQIPLSTYDIILLDIDLCDNSDKKGFEILRHIKKTYSNIPVIMITGHNEYHFMEEAFQSGAHDYIIKPFRTRELQIRIQRWFRNYIFLEYFSTHKVLEYYDILYDVSSYEFYYKTKKIPLSRSNKYVLSLFFIHRERLLSQNFLLEKIWGRMENDIEKNLRIKILRLKNQLKTVGIDTWIETVRGEGYIFRKPFMREV